MKFTSTSKLLFLLFPALFSNTAYSQYCIPSPGTISSCGSTIPATIRINSVSTTGAITNINNNNNACNGYTYYNGAGNTVVADAGINLTLNVNTPNAGGNYPYRIIVWVDWDQDGVFDNTLYNPITMTGERMLVSPSSPASSAYTSGMYTATFPVPPNALNGLTRMRIRGGTRNAGTIIAWPNATTADPCMAVDFAHGEVEDYDFQVVNPCTVPAKMFYSNLTYNSARVAWSKKHNAKKYEYWISTVQAVPDPGTGNYLTTDTAVSLPNANIPLICGTRYYVYVRSICDTSKNQANWEMSPWKMDYFDVPPCCYTPKVSIANVTGTTAIVSWNPVQSVHQYEYVVSNDTATPPSGNITTQTSVVLTGLAPGKEWYFFLRAHCSPTPLSQWGLDSFLTQPGLSVGQYAGGNQAIASVYPNPVKDNINIHITEGIRNGKATVTIYDIAGKALMVVNAGSDVIQIPFSYANGVYILKYADDKNTFTTKFYKE